MDLDDPHGLIAIEEAKDFAPQNIFFCLPLAKKDWSKIRSYSDLIRFLKNSRFHVTLRDDKKNIKTELHQENNVLSFQYLGKSVYFKVEEQINFGNTIELRNSIIDFSKLLEIIKDISTLAILVINVFLWRSLRRKSVKEKFEGVEIKEIINSPSYRRLLLSLPNYRGLQYTYSGFIYQDRFQDNRFVILTLQSAKPLDELYIQNNVCLI